MAFITVNNNTIAFADYNDALNTDQRLFEANEGLTEDVVDEAMIRSTERILFQIRSTDWWRDLILSHTINGATNYIQNLSDLPYVDANKILFRKNDFNELCVNYAFWRYLLPRIADFSKEDNAERAKIGFYQERYNILFEEIINAGDWYDLDGFGKIDSTEKMPGQMSLRRVR